MSNSFYSSIWPAMVDRHINQLSRTLDILEATFKSETDDLYKYYKNTIDFVNDKRQFREDIAEEAWELDHMSHISRTSLFTVCFAFLENEINNFCSICKAMNKTELAVKDIHGNGINRAKTYLKKLHGIDMSQIKGWGELKILNKIRNCILHNGGKIHAKDIKALEDYQRRYNNIEINNQTRVIILQFQFCSETFELTKSFLLELHKKIKTKKS